MLNKISQLIGLDIKELDKYLIDNGVYEKAVKSCHTVENAVAVLLDEDLPRTKKGRDFNSFEVKTLNVKRIGNGEFRTKGDTQISKYEYTSELLETNLWDKLKKIILVLHIDNKVVDVRYLDNSSKLKELQKEYLNFTKPGHRKLNSLIVRKGFNKINPDSKDDMIMIKGSEAIIKSISIAEKQTSKSLNTIFKGSITQWLASNHKIGQNPLKRYSDTQLFEELKRRELV